MKTLKYIMSLALIVFIGCSEEDKDLSFIDNVEAPSNVSALFQPTQDNSGLVIITPNSNGGVSYNITLGDGSDAVSLQSGQNVENTYAEGNYTVEIEAVGITGLKTTTTQELVVSFRAPENLVVTIENDAAISKQVNVTATADFAMSYQVFFGETGTNEPLVANIGESVSYNYIEAGVYSIRIVAMGAAIATTEYIEEFEVTAILQPLASAPTPPFRQETDVIGVFTDRYTYDTANNFFPNWGQGDCCGSSWTLFDLDGDEMLQYINLSYQGIEMPSAIDASSMEMLHVDMWTAEELSVDIFPLPDGIAPADEKFVTKQLVPNQWNSFDIPLTEFTSQGLALNDIKQFKFVGTPFGGGASVFIDNIYFWKEPSVALPLLFDDFDGNSNITTWLGDQCGMDNAFANPYRDANNLSHTVLEYNDTGGTYANIQFLAGSKLDLSGGNSIFKFKIYVPSASITGSQPNQVSLKLQNSDLGGNAWQTQTEIVKTITLDQWQEVSFNFETDNWQNLNFNGVDPNPVDRTDLDKIVIQVNSENNNNLVKAYIDDFYYGNTPTQDPPPYARDGFEGNGTITTWLGDDCGMDNTFANPFIDNNNNSATVLQYNDTGGTYANIQFTVTPNLDMVSKSKFTLQVYVPSSSITGTQPNQISLKLQNGNLAGNAWQTQTEIVKPIVLDQWQEITFDFVNDNWQNLNFNGTDPDPIDRTDLNKVVLQINSENNNDLVTAYIDNFNYHN